ncbi:SSU ribosomal protein S16P [Neorhodopirellula lusitana]|uniref:30S ribosomal protein S16 n=2 Tax=Neorhodopirellula lusitana TaxID=445327 RepID=A0ABY1QJA5_9BACT|nr:SSU ribosomal protein S16P [Neorhodopirellula lusitana]
MDQRKPRDGRVIEELGYYDPMCPETDARAILKGDRIAYWVGVGAQPTEKCAVLIKKYGEEGTHLDAQKAALDRLGKRKDYTPAPAAPAPKPQAPEPVAEAAPAEEAPAEEAAAPAEGASEEAATE